MAQTTFTSAIDDWVRETKERGEFVFKTAAQRVVSEMQEPIAAGGHMPVDTGFLRASLTASTSTMPTIRPGAAPEEGQRYAYDAAAVALVIAGAELGQTLYMGYVAAYARPVHYGANGKPGRQWVTLAAQRWPAIVAQVTAEARAQSV